MRRISLNIFTHALMLAALLAFSAAPALAQVSVSLPAVTAVAGESGTIDLTVGDLTGEDVISYQFTIEYDPAVVDLTGATVAGTISEGIELSVDTSDANSITVAAAGVSALSGSGTLVSLDADFVGAGQSPLTITGFQFNEGTPASTVTDGLVTVPEVVVAFGEAAVTDSTVSIPINTTSSLTGEGILSYQFTVMYDPAIINLTGFDATGTLSQGMSIQHNAATANSLTIAAAGTADLEGEGTLINLTGTPVAEGTTTLTFTAFQFNEGTPIGGGNPGTIEIAFGVQEGTAENPLEIPLAPSPPTIDGQVDSTWLSAAKQVSMEKVVGGSAPDDAADLSGDVWVMYDATNLYVLYNIRDDELINDSPNSWEDDAVDLYIDGGNEHVDSTRDANDAQFEFSWGDTSNAITGGTQGLVDGVDYAWTTTLSEAGDTTGYYLEAIVPWENFGVKPAGNMEMIGIEFMVNDDDPPGGATRDTKLAWFSNEDNAWQWSHVLGYAVLVGTPPIGTEGSPLEIPTTPGPPKIDGIIDLAWAEHGSSVTIGNTVTDPGTEPTDDADLSGEVWFMYDKGNLYVLYDVNDANLINDSPNSWEDDAVDLYIDAGNEHMESGRDANDAQYEFSWGDDSLAVTGGTQGNDEDVTYAWSTKTNEAGDTLGYIVEAQVPWKNFSDVLNPSGEGELIGIEFMINDDDPPGGATRDTKTAWFANEDNAWQWSHVLGYAKLVGDPIGSGDPWAPYEIMFAEDGAPELDGEREGLWDQAHRLELNKWSGDNQPTDLADLNPSAELLFDGDYLYVYYQTPDDALFNDSGATWQDDSFDLDIDGDNEKTMNAFDDDDASLEFGYNATVVTLGGNTTADKGEGVEFVSVETADGYAIEARVPWANFNLIAEAGTEIGLEIKANDDDLGGDTRDTKYGWYEGTDNAWQWAHVFGTAVLVGGDVAAEPDGELPERFAIESVYPNPFNPSTTAVVSIREVGDYDVRIYNVLGQLIEKRMITAQIPGRMEVSFDFGRFASGLYMISVKNMQTGKIATAKAILTK